MFHKFGLYLFFYTDEKLLCYQKTSVSKTMEKHYLILKTLEQMNLEHK